MDTFADELLVKIFRYLPQGKDLHAVSLTCRPFNRCIEERLWQSIRLHIPPGVTERHADETSLQRLVNHLSENPRLSKYVKTVNFSIQQVIRWALQAKCIRLLANFPNLQHLSFTSGVWRLGRPEIHSDLWKAISLRSMILGFDFDENLKETSLRVINHFVRQPSLRAVQIVKPPFPGNWCDKLPVATLDIEEVRAFECCADYGSSIIRLVEAMKHLRIFDLVLGTLDLNHILRTAGQMTLYAALRQHHQTLEELSLSITPTDVPGLPSQKHSRDPALNATTLNSDLQTWTFMHFTSLRKLVLPYKIFYSNLWKILPPQLELFQINHWAKFEAYAGQTIISHDHLQLLAFKARTLVSNRALLQLRLKELVWCYHDVQISEISHLLEWLRIVRDIFGEAEIDFKWTVVERAEEHWHAKPSNAQTMVADACVVAEE